MHPEPVGEALRAGAWGQHFCSTLVSQNGASHREMLQVIVEAEYLWLPSPAALSHGCGAELGSFRCVVTNSSCTEAPLP